MEGFNEFFKNPTWISLIAILGYFIYQTITKIIDNKKKSKETASLNKEKQEITEKQEISYKTLDRLSDAVEQLTAKEINHVNLMTAEKIIEKQLIVSKTIIKDEIIRIFDKNHRENINRQKIIKQKIENVTQAVFENDIKTLNSISCKNKKLSDFLFNINNERFFSDLLKLLFTTGGEVKSEFADVIYFIDSSFERFILDGKKFYNDL